MASQQDVIIKVIIVGDSGVGKTSIFTTYIDQIYRNMHIPTIGVDYALQKIQLDDKLVKLQIWDTAGLERYRSLTCHYFRGADVICIVYDITNRESFANLEKWIRVIEEDTGGEDFLYVFIGNKIDKAAFRKVSAEEGALFAAARAAGFFETSAKTAASISDVFTGLAKEVLQRGNTKHVPRVIEFPLEEEPKDKPKRFCWFF